ncbi:hypothetical protein Btru_035736 [Bulinus truncatus]|nr:hypothetical protein Btru_035736 [Bulinus truncatus]
MVHFTDDVLWCTSQMIFCGVLHRGYSVVYFTEPEQKKLHQRLRIVLAIEEELALLEAVELALLEAVELGLLEAVELALLEAAELALLEAVELALLEAVELPLLEAVELALFETVELALLEAVDFVNRLVQLHLENKSPYEGLHRGAKPGKVAAVVTPSDGQ